jgi:hypothetical protein
MTTEHISLYEHLIKAIDESPCKTKLYENISASCICMRKSGVSSSQEFVRVFDRDCLNEYKMPKLQSVARAVDKICGQNTQISNAFWAYTSDAINTHENNSW